MLRVLAAPALLAASLVPATASAADNGLRAFVQASHGPEAAGLAAGLQWDTGWSRPWGAGRLALLHDVALGRLRSDVRPGGHETFTQFGWTPALRWWREDRAAGWFGELGIGLNVITPRYRNRDDTFSTTFNFGDHLALGWRGTGGTEWALRVQHFSNGGIDKPNPGANFVQLRVALPLNGL